MVDEKTASLTPLIHCISNQAMTKAIVLMLAYISTRLRK